MAERTGVAARRRDIARRFRQNPTPAERKLWNLLRSKRDAGWKFRRQQPIGPFFADFVCLAAKLVVELDGGQHGEPERIRRDDARSRWLKEHGYRVLRFWNFEVLNTPHNVLDAIWNALENGK